MLRTAEEARDPNALLRAGKASLERRASSALDPEEAIRRYRRCVIVGDPGAGKTTLLKFLALKAASPFTGRLVT
jgi:predicted NACHT family NTPase